MDARASNVGFTSQSISSDDGMIQYSYRIRCALNFFGPDCSRFCVPMDNSTGHFNCTLNGEKVCLPGYANISRSTGSCTECVSGFQNVTCPELGQHNIFLNLLVPINACAHRCLQ